MHLASIAFGRDDDIADSTEAASWFAAELRDRLATRG
jgi:hypothetical protein